MILDWKNKKVKVFLDQHGTKFTRGPFMINDNVYDWHLEDNDGTDLCTNEQMMLWNIIMVENLSEND